MIISVLQKRRTRHLHLSHGNFFWRNLLSTVLCLWFRHYELFFRVAHPKTGRILEVYSDQPGVQFYTSNWMPDPNNTVSSNSSQVIWNKLLFAFGQFQIYPEGQEHENKAPSDETEPIFGKKGALYFKHSSFCLETQNFPDAVNHVNCFIYKSIQSLLIVSLLISRKTSQKQSITRAKHMNINFCINCW